MAEVQLSRSTTVDDFIAAFEAVYLRDGTADWREFLPQQDHPAYRSVLRELIRVDLEFGWQRGKGRALQDYLDSLPGISEDRELIAAAAFEEFRQRRRAGEQLTPAEFAERYRIDVSSWEEQLAASSVRQAPPPSGDDSFDRMLNQLAEKHRHPGEADSLATSGIGNLQAGGPFPPTRVIDPARDLPGCDPDLAVRLVKGVSWLPSVGSQFHGFQLIAELGRGAFGSVYLAEQSELAARFVVLKVGGDLFGESHSLAQLQHTNIVPIYSLHRGEALQTVCMPYLGSTTLADVLYAVRTEAEFPTSARVLVSTLRTRSANTRKAVESSRADEPSVPESPAVPAGAPADASPGTLPGNLVEDALENLQGTSYVRSILGTALQIAGALVHAHERGILHRDIKPANILLTDDGRPMLLDFNLSEDVKRRDCGAIAAMGGTLPYMSPEQLKAFAAGGRGTVDGRTDVYSLGVVLFELLTGKAPFPTRNRKDADFLKVMIADRRREVPWLRPLNPQVTPAVEAIVRRCLEPDLEQRYQSALELQEDLDRHLKDLPLKHVPEPSVRERARKWVRRHPRLTSLTSIALAAVLLLAVTVATLAYWKQRLDRAEAETNYAAFLEDTRPAQFILYHEPRDRDELQQGVAACEKALAHYPVFEDEAWDKARSLRLLPDENRDRVKETTAELLYLLAGATARQAETETGQGKHDKLERAWQLNALAERRGGEGFAHRSLLKQRSDLAGLLEKKAEAEQCREQADAVAEETSRDRYLEAHRLIRRGKFREAQALLVRVTREDPDNYAAWFSRGDCHRRREEYADAIGCYNVCIALRPMFPWGWHNRGEMFLNIHADAEALADCTRAIELDPQLGNAYLDRGLAHAELHHYPEAIADLSEALKLTRRTRIYFTRARIHAQFGHPDLARKDVEEGLRKEPSDADSWCERGLYRLDATKDANGALADYEQALKLDPRWLNALQNKAGVLADRLDRTDEAIATLTQAIEYYPDYVPVRAARGVYLARQGKCAQAREDAEQALLRDGRPPNLYQVGCIFSLTAKHSPEDRFRAFPLLRRALLAEFGLDWLDTDHDLDPLRECPEFKKLVADVRARHPDPAGKKSGG